MENNIERMLMNTLTEVQNLRGGPSGGMSRPASALDELDAFFRKLPPGDVEAVEKDGRYVAAKVDLFFAFLIHLLNSPMGYQFAVSGLGLTKAQALLTMAKDVYGEISAGSVSERDATRELLEQMKAQLADNAREIAGLKDQLGIQEG